MNPADLSAIVNSIDRSAGVIRSLKDQAEVIAAIASEIVRSLKRGNKVLTCGHGGSAAEALHMAEELMGRFDKDRRPLPAVALTADPTLLTCIGNDYGFPEIFSRQVEGLGCEGDVLVVFSTSGNGEGLKRAVQAARAKKVTAIGLLGKRGGIIRNDLDFELIVASDETARIQEAHQLVMHLILEAVDRDFA